MLFVVDTPADNIINYYYRTNILHRVVVFSFVVCCCLPFYVSRYTCKWIEYRSTQYRDDSQQQQAAPMNKWKTVDGLWFNYK